MPEVYGSISCFGSCNACFSYFFLLVSLDYFFHSLRNGGRINTELILITQKRNGETKFIAILEMKCDGGDSPKKAA